MIIYIYLLEEVRREDVGEGFLGVVDAGDGGDALHGGEVMDLVRVVHPRVGPRRRCRRCHGPPLAIYLGQRINGPARASDREYCER